MSGGGSAWRWPIVALAAFGAVYIWEILTLTGIPVARDMQMFFVPQKHLLWEALQDGRIPLWTPFIGNGSPFLANLQSGVFYPPHWLYAILPYFTAFNLLLVIHFLLGGGFALLLCRRLGLSPVAAYVAAATWMFGGYFASLLNLVNALQGAAWAPGLSWAALRWLDGGGRRAFALLIGICALAILAGEPQSFIFASFAALTVGTLHLTRAGPSARDLRALGGQGVLAVIVVCGLVMIQVLPTLELLSESSREGGLTYGEAAAFDLVPIRLIHLLVPTDYRDPEYTFGVRSIIGRGDPWLFSVYVGALSPLLIRLALRNRRWRREAAAWSVIAGLAILVALGDHTPVFPWLFEHVPGFGSFRFPEKYFFAVAFAAMLLSGWGMESLLADEPGRGDRTFAAGYFGVALVGLIGFLAAREPIRRFAVQFGNDRMMEDFGFAYGVWAQNIGKLVFLIGLFLVLVRLFRSGHLSRAVFGPLVALLVTADLMVAHRDLNPVVAREFYETEPTLFEHVPIEEVRRDYRLRVSRFDSVAGTIPVIRGVPLEAQKWLWQQLAAPNVGQYWGVLEQDAWDAIKLRRIRDELDIQRVIPDEARRWSLLRLQSVRYVHSILDVDPAGVARRIPLGTLPGHLFELEEPLPRAYVVPESRRLPHRDSVINAVLAPDFDPRHIVVIEDSGAAASIDAPPEPAEPLAARSVAGFPGAAITESMDEEVRIRLDPGVSGHLVLTDNYYPGWVAEVDGEPRPIELANFFFRGVEIRSGDREVVFSYRSVPFERGRLVSLMTLALASLGFLLLEIRAARSARTPPRTIPPGR